MKYPLLTALFAALGLLFPMQSVAEADFLLLEPSAKALGMGGAFAASSGSLDSLRYNPAGLAGLKGSSYTISHQDDYGEWSHEWAAAALSVDGTAYALEYSTSNLRGFELYDEGGSSLGMASAGSQALGFSAARSLFGIDAGASLHGFSSHLMEFTSTGYSADLGLRYGFKGTGLSLALAGQNLGEMTSFDGGKEDLPSLYRAGLAWDGALGDAAALAVHLDALRFTRESYESEIRAGARISLLKTLSLSGGMRWSPSRAQGTLGLGVTVGAFELSYAFMPGSLLGNTQLISLELNL